MRMKFFSVLAYVILWSPIVRAQNKITVTGTVTDGGTSSPLSHATILLKGAERNIGQTDSSGKFSVSVPLGSELEFSFIGYETRRLRVNSAGPHKIALKSSGKSEESVLVQAFSTRTKETVTGSTQRIKGAEVQGVPVSDFMQMLQGKAVGLNIQNVSGSPGGMASINMGGVSTVGLTSDGYLTPTSPLFVIDGVPVDLNAQFAYGFISGASNVNPLSLIPPDDIETIDILRDAAAISQYGSKGTYGVILVTTKRGRSNIPVVQYSADFFIRTPPKLLATVGGREERLRRLRTIFEFDTSNIEVARAYANEISFLTDSLNPYYNNSTNWQSYFYRTTFNNTHNLQISGGSQVFNYKTNLNYYNENGIVKGTEFNRYTLGMNATYNPIPQLRLTTSINASLGARGNGSGNGALQMGVASSASSSSLLPPPSRFSSNNVALSGDANNNKEKKSSINTNISIMVEPFKGLQLNNVFSYSYSASQGNTFKPSWLSGNTSSYSNSSTKAYSFYNRTLISYIKELGKHSFNPYLFTELTANTNRRDDQQFIANGNDQILGPTGWALNFSERNRTRGGAMPFIEERVHAFGGSFSYNYDRKYVLTFDYRLDKTSTNGPNLGYKKSPTISGRWNFTKEKFLQKFKALSTGAIRGSYGTVIRPVGTIYDVYGSYKIGNYYNNNPTVSIDFSKIPNPNFRPESKTQLTGALELGFLNDRYMIFIEPYYNHYDNQLWDVRLSDVTAFDSKTTNGASVVNMGLNLSTSLRIIDRPKHKLSIDANINYDKGVIAALPGGIREDMVDVGGGVKIVRRLGRNQFSNLMLVNRGVYAKTEDVPVNPLTGLRMQYGRRNDNQFFKAGDPIWVDVNGDYVIDDNDLVPVGNPVPLFFGGFNPTYIWGRFMIRVGAAFTIKRDVLNAVAAERLKDYSSPNSFSAMLPINEYDYWRPLNGDLNSGSSNAKYPNPFDFRRSRALGPFRIDQTLFMEDGTYFKINSVSISYTLDEALIKRFGLTQCRINASANNLWMFTNYSGVNPENVSSTGRDESGGYPSARGYSLGVQLRF